ncbi:MAG TPA: methyltransferase domain-containing protein [Casimicrobiaceae bacterium]|nr:methyltransferase domain-containing protein [Casimicrobiaceae bacterium]
MRVRRLIRSHPTVSSKALAALRARYAETVAASGKLRSTALRAALARVPREAFVGPGPWQIGRFDGQVSTYERTPDDDPAHVYVDAVIALDASRNLNNGEPTFLTRCLDALELEAGNRFVHVGCGTGYYTALAAEVVGPGGAVTAVEIDAELARRASRNLSMYSRVRVLHANGSDLDFDSADAVFFNAGVTKIDDGWAHGLAIRGRLLLPLTVDEPSLPPGLGVGRLLKLTRQPDGIDAHFISTVGIFHCAGARDERSAGALRASLARGDAETVSRLRTDPHDEGSACWLHAPAWCLSR